VVARPLPLAELFQASVTGGEGLSEVEFRVVSLYRVYYCIFVHKSGRCCDGAILS
jgi:hypothetical protein